MSGRRFLLVNWFHLSRLVGHDRDLWTGDRSTDSHWAEGVGLKNGKGSVVQSDDPNFGKVVETYSLEALGGPGLNSVSFRKGMALGP